jgi:hypothetical protein
MTTVALVALVAWVLVLSLVVLLLVRQVSLLSVRLTLAGATVAQALDGPELGTDVPASIADLLPARRHVALLALSADCNACRELAAALHGRALPTEVVALVSGNGDAASVLVDLLPAELPRILEPQASRLLEELEVRSRPFALVLEGRIVRAKGSVHEPHDLFRFLDRALQPFDPAASAEEVAYAR